jgi:hypothetical protein
MVPVMKCSGVTPIESKHGTNYAPNISLVKWTDRPDELHDTGTPKKVETLKVVAPVAEAEEGDDDEF